MAAVQDSARVQRSSRLDEFLGRLNWSPERLAREINQLHGTEMVSLKAPYHWLRGSYPRGDMPDIVAGILSAQLTEDIDAGQIWLSVRPEVGLGPARASDPGHDGEAPPRAADLPTRGLGVLPHPAGAPDPAAPTHATGIPNRTTGIPAHGAGAPTHATGIPNHATGAPYYATGVPGHGAGAPTHAVSTLGHGADTPAQCLPDHGGDSSARAVGGGEEPALSPVPGAVDAAARMAAVLDWLAGAGGQVTTCGCCRRPIWPDLLRVVELRASQVLDLYEKYGGAAALDIAAADLASAHALAQSMSCDGRQARRLYRAIAQLSETAGLSAAQVGDPDGAHRQLLAGLWAAQVTGDRALGAQLIAALCETLPDSGREALRLISVAIHGARGCDERVGRRLRCRQALAYARLGDVAAFGPVAEALTVDALADRDDPGGAGLHVAELGLGWLDLDRPVEAARALEAGLALLGDRHPYKRLQFSSALALALLRVGQGESAGRVVTGIRGLAVHLRADLDGLLPTELREAVGT